MRGLPFVVFALSAALAACHLPARPLVDRPPRADEGEIAVFVRSTAGGSRRVTVTLGAVAAAPTAGPSIPLDLRLTELVAGPGVEGGQRQLAGGRLPPKPYAGLMVSIRRATVTAPDGSQYDLLVPQDPVLVPVPFAVARAGGLVVWLTLRTAELGGQAGVIDGVPFSAVIPHRPNAMALGFCTLVGSDAVAVFDRRAREVVALLPTGAGPSGIVLDPQALKVRVALSGSDEIQTFDLQTLEPLDAVRLRPGDRPSSMGQAPGGLVMAVADEGGDAVSVVEVDRGVELSRIPVGEQPVHLTLDRSGRRAFVSSRSAGTLSVVDLQAGTLAMTIRLEGNPVRSWIDGGATRLYVAYGNRPFITIHSLPDGLQAGRLFTGMDVSGLVGDPRTGSLFVAHGDDPRLQIFDGRMLVPVGAVALPAPASALAIDDAENVLFAVMPGAGAVAAVDLSSRKVVGIMEVGPGPREIALMGERR